MVATPSAAQAAQTAENDKRKKTQQQTVEKVKTSHVCAWVHIKFLIGYYMIYINLQQLTRQLQMRLQYARLKVENGWVRLCHPKSI